MWCVPALGLPPFSMGLHRFMTHLSRKQANAKARTNKEKTGGGITPRARCSGFDVNPSTVFVVLLQVLQIYTRALPPPTHHALF